MGLRSEEEGGGAQGHEDETYPEVACPELLYSEVLRSKGERPLGWDRDPFQGV